MRLLWLRGDAPSRSKLEESLAGTGDCIDFARYELQALDLLRVRAYDVVLVSLPLPDWTESEFLEEAHRADQLASIVVDQDQASLADAARLTKLGACHVVDGFSSPEHAAEVARQVAGEAQQRRRALSLQYGESEPWRKWLVGESRVMEDIASLVRLVGPRRCTVLVTGETGVGKEMVARAIHLAGPRSNVPMVSVNCSALPENLLEAELFGHVRGAFTGAVQSRIGRFEQAHRGTLFLDEVGEMPLELQCKLLRVLQEREFQRLGSSETVKVDVRIIAASNADLVERVRQGKFREDLYYRLNVVPLQVPPLRARTKDIPVLAYHFLGKVCLQEDVALKRISPEALDRLCGYDWPGNVRQLENAVEMAVVLSGDRPMLYPGDFPLPSTARLRPAAMSTSPTPVVNVPDEGLNFEQTIQDIELALLQQALQRTQGNKKQAAELLRMKRTTLTAKLKTMSAS